MTVLSTQKCVHRTAIYGHFTKLPYIAVVLKCLVQSIAIFCKQIIWWVEWTPILAHSAWAWDSSAQACFVIFINILGKCCECCTVWGCSLRLPWFFSQVHDILHPGDEYHHFYLMITILDLQEVSTKKIIAMEVGMKEQVSFNLSLDWISNAKNLIQISLANNNHICRSNAVAKWKWRRVRGSWIIYCQLVWESEYLLLTGVLQSGPSCRLCSLKSAINSTSGTSPYSCFRFLPTTFNILYLFAPCYWCL